MGIINWIKTRLQGIKLFLKEVYIEGKKVDWPSREETIRYTLIVIVISVTIAAFLGGLDFIFMGILQRFVL